MIGIADPLIDPGQSLRQTREAVSRATAIAPRVSLMLGSGLGALAQSVESACRIPYADLPHMPAVSAPGHHGELVLGRIEGAPVAVFSGRFHYYEGIAPWQIAYPVWLSRALGAETIFLTSIVGSMNPEMPPGTLVLIDDHINLMGINPLIGPNDERIGPRFPDMSAPYDARLQGIAREVAQTQGIRLLTGVYAGVAGPNLETRAEYRMLRRMGADVVGMSMVPEVIAARHCGLNVLAVAVVSDACLPDQLQPAVVEDLLRVAAETEPKLTTLLRGVLQRL